MGKIEITNYLIDEVASKHIIEKGEAKKRLELLFESGILKTGNPTAPETIEMIDTFLAQPSEQSVMQISFEKCFTMCLEKEDFVKQYDRLTNSSFGATLRLIASGNPPRNTDKQFAKFGDFVRKTVFEIIIQSQP